MMRHRRDGIGVYVCAVIEPLASADVQTPATWVVAGEGNKPIRLIA